jgi:hypothetical protein
MEKTIAIFSFILYNNEYRKNKQRSYIRPTKIEKGENEKIARVNYCAAGRVQT